jgi:molecular chaperone GrpE
MSEKSEEQSCKEEDRLKELTEALEEERKRSEGYLSKLQYLQADFENLRKRLDRQMEETRKYSNERLILEMLEVVDDMEAAVRARSSSSSVDQLVQGVEMTLKKLRKLLANEEVHPIPAQGETFDPLKHEAIARIESKGAEEGRIVEEVRKGYIMRGKVIRPSVVKIGVKPSPESQREEKRK